MSDAPTPVPVPVPTPTVAGLHDLKEAINRVGVAVSQMNIEPETTIKILEAVLHILQDHDQRLRVLEAAANGEPKRALV